MIDTNKIGAKITELRRERSMTQAQLAALMNVSHQAVSKWESGKALPDTETLLKLAEFFGITAEQLVRDEEKEIDMAEENMKDVENAVTPGEEQENVRNNMTVQQLIQMAPFMTKEAVEAIAMTIEARMTATQIAKLAPYLRSETLDALIAKHKPQFSWDTLRKIVPFMSRESVDELARSIVSGREAPSPTSEEFNKTMDDVGKAFDEFGKGFGQTFDDIGKGVERVVRKALRIGESVINDVSDALNEIVSEEENTGRKRSDRARQIRANAFRRALNDGQWVWIGKHVEELDDMPDVKSEIVLKARELDMHDWISKFMASSSDEATIDNAVESDDWNWLGDNAWSFEPALQQRAALAAMRAENWQWLSLYADQLDLSDCGYEISEKALLSGATVLAKQLAETHLDQTEKNALARKAFDSGDDEALELLIPLTDDSFQEDLLIDLAEQGDWKHIEECAKNAPVELIERLMEYAVEQGNFDAVDMLDELL